MKAEGLNVTLNVAPGERVQSKGEGRGERRMETPNFIPLETLNLLDSILSTVSLKTDLTDPTGSAAHTCTAQVPGCPSLCYL